MRSLYCECAEVSPEIIESITTHIIGHLSVISKQNNWCVNAVTTGLARALGVSLTFQKGDDFVNCFDESIRIMCDAFNNADKECRTMILDLEVEMETMQ